MTLMSAAAFMVAKCAQCGAVYFPRRLICRRCGANDWTDVQVSEAVIEEATTVSHSVGSEGEGQRHFATARTSEGLRLVIGSSELLNRNARVRLAAKDGAPFAMVEGKGPPD
jgi:uncharacterized OB-fold protein